MKMKNAEAMKHLQDLKNLEGLETALPAVVGYRIIQNVRSFTNALAAYEEMRDRTIRKYAKDGKTVKQEEDPEAFDACVAELETLDALEVEVEIEKIPISMMKDRDVPLKTIFALDFMLE